jgi:F-type H+-transporting ATPase subunit epsilon
MSEEFKVEIVNPEKSFLFKEDVTEVVVPAFEGEMGILKDHISIISFLKPGIVKVYSKSEENKYFLEDGIVEFKDNSLSILTSSIYNISDLDRNKIDQIVKDAEKESGSDNIDDQKRYLIDQKIEVLKSLQLN